MVYEIEFNREQDKDDSILSELGELKTGELSYRSSMARNR